jgi:hypothetical protein
MPRTEQPWVWCHGAGPDYTAHALAMLAARYAKVARAHFVTL